jgi:hypothetical protein
MLAALLAGIVAGSVHVVSGPDHLAAVAPLAATSRGRAWLAGLRWGLGHTTGAGLVGIVALLLREALPLEAISAWSERLVGVVLVGIGLWALRSVFRYRVHEHEHEHGAVHHVHFHLHGARSAHRTSAGHEHGHAAFGVGALHGVAGTSHLAAVIPALALPSGADAVAYLGGYGLGTIAAMSAFAFAVGGVAARLGASADAVYRRFVTVCGSAAIAVGVAWIILSGR